MKKSKFYVVTHDAAGRSKLPGADLTRACQIVSESTIRRWARAGWVRLVGTGIVLTQAGYGITYPASE